jgi:hypothetical protein
MKKVPKFRIIGKAPKEEKEKAKKELYDLLFKHLESLPPAVQERVKKFEFPKNEEEILFINFANEETNNLRRKFGLDPYNIPIENYHIIPHEYYEKTSKNSAAETFLNKQALVFDVEELRSNPLYAAALIIHETLHLKGHLTLELQIEDQGNNKREIKKTPYREGVSIRALQKHGMSGNYHEHFEGLHEAIIQYQTKKSFKKLLDLKEMEEYKNWMNSDEAKQIKQKINQENIKRGRGEIAEDNFIWVSKDGKNWKTFSYLKLTEVLDYICEEIQKEFKTKYKNKDEVFEEFLKAHFTGQLLTIARLVEKTFGKRSFRILGNMETSSTSGVLYLETLKKLRSQQIRKN